MNKKMKAAGLGLAVLFGGEAAAQNVTYEYPNGVERTANCQAAFYVFKDDPQRVKWYTCDGFEAVDIPMGGDKNDPGNRDAICSITDQYDPRNPISIHDPQYESAKADFLTANIQALAHASLNHGESVNIAIRLRAKMGVDVFDKYKNFIRRAEPQESADWEFNIAPNDDTTKVRIKYINGWTKQKADQSAYMDVRNDLCP